MGRKSISSPFLESNRAAWTLQTQRYAVRMGTCLFATDSAAVNMLFYLSSATCDCVVYRLSYNWTLVKSLVDRSALLSTRYSRSEKPRKSEVRLSTIHCFVLKNQVLLLAPSCRFDFTVSLDSTRIQIPDNI